MNLITVNFVQLVSPNTTGTKLLLQLVSTYTKNSTVYSDTGGPGSHNVLSQNPNKVQNLEETPFNLLDLWKIIYKFITFAIILSL